MAMVIEAMGFKENLAFFYDFTKIYQITLMNKLSSMNAVRGVPKFEYIVIAYRKTRAAA
jgi:hypothetical protein